MTKREHLHSFRIQIKVNKTNLNLTQFNLAGASFNPLSPRPSSKFLNPDADFRARLPPFLYDALSAIAPRLEVGRIGEALAGLKKVKDELMDENKFCSRIPINLGLEY